MRPAAQQFKDLIPTLIEALKDADPEVRQNSAIALASLGQDALAPLKEALKDANKEKRAAAAYALGQMGHAGRDAMPDLLKVMKDEEVNVRRAASQAISRLVADEGQMFGFGMVPRGLGGFRPPSGPFIPAPPTPTPVQAPADKK
jgi:HEAT repeat protein